MSANTRNSSTSIEPPRPKKPKLVSVDGLAKLYSRYYDLWFYGKDNVECHKKRREHHKLKGGNRGHVITPFVISNRR